MITITVLLALTVIIGIILVAIFGIAGLGITLVFGDTIIGIALFVMLIKRIFRRKH